MIFLHNKDDIIIPFEAVGEPGWEEKTRMLLYAFAENWGENLPEPVTEELIAVTEKRLGVRLPDTLTLFYRVFGIADIGEELQALENMQTLADWTEGFDWDEAGEKEKEMLPHLVTFSEYLGNGNAFCFHRETGSVYYFDHETEPYLVKLFDKVDDYLKGCLIALQEHFFESSDAADIVEEKLLEVFSEGVITKWMY